MMFEFVSAIKTGMARIQRLHIMKQQPNAIRDGLMKRCGERGGGTSTSNVVDMFNTFK